LAGLALGFAGVLVVLGAWHGVGGAAGRGGASLSGQAMLFGAVACYGFAFPYMRRNVAGRPYTGVALSAGQLVMATMQLAIIAPFVAGPPPAPWRLSPSVIGSVAVLGAAGTGLAFALNFHVVRVAGATTASTVTYLPPVVATLAGVVVLHEQLTWNQPVGAVVVLAGVAVSQGVLKRLRRARP
jgi:drug/metabolite transporter (DMT)-like permease